MISELKRAFEIGFLLFIPFIVVDMVVASVLMSMGMMMLPPVIISLPFKLIFFVLVDGWNLVCAALVQSFLGGLVLTWLFTATSALWTALAAALMVLFAGRSEEHTSELQSLMRISYAVFCLKKTKKKTIQTTRKTT